MEYYALTKEKVDPCVHLIEISRRHIHEKVMDNIKNI